MDLKIDNNSNSGIQAISDPPSEGLIIRRCRIERNGFRGIWLNGFSVLVENSTIRANGNRGVYAGGPSVPSPDVYGLFRHNTFSFNGEQSIFSKLFLFGISYNDNVTGTAPDGGISAGNNNCNGKVC